MYQIRDLHVTGHSALISTWEYSSRFPAFGCRIHKGSFIFDVRIQISMIPFYSGFKFEELFEAGDCRLKTATDGC